MTDICVFCVGAITIDGGLSEQAFYALIVAIALLRGCNRISKK
jgi:hypothetical protein